MAIHGGKTQEERIYAIDSFKSRKKDVLVANDIASKGIDLQNIQHVINYDMPNEIEDYVHRIGRTGRGGSTGIATTFVDPTTCSEAVLLDLKLLLAEARQNIPSFLSKLGELPSNAVPCSICGGLGHGIDKCPKVSQSIIFVVVLTIYRLAPWPPSNFLIFVQIIMIVNINKLYLEIYFKTTIYCQNLIPQFNSSIPAATRYFTLFLRMPLDTDTNLRVTVKFFNKLTVSPIPNC